jgi:hypothetical protein
VPPWRQEPLDRAHESQRCLHRGRIDGDDIVSWDEGAGVRARPGEHDRPRALALEFRIVPAAAQVVAVVIVRGEGHPGRLRGSVGALRKVDRDHLPVGLVVVDASERRAPVVHRVEVPVLQADVSAVADNASVVGEAARVELLAVDHLRRRGEPRRHLAAQKQRGTQPRVEQAAEHPGRCEPSGRAEALARHPPPAAVLRAPQRLLHEPQEQLRVATENPFARQALERQLALWCQLGPLAAAYAGPEAALRDIWIDRRRQEQLPSRVSDHRLVRPQQCQVGVSGSRGSKRVHGRVGSCLSRLTCDGHRPLLSQQRGLSRGSQR